MGTHHHLFTGKGSHSTCQHDPMSTDGLHDSALLQYHVKLESTGRGTPTDHQTIWSQGEYFRVTLFISARGTAFPTAKNSSTKYLWQLLIHYNNMFSLVTNTVDFRKALVTQYNIMR